MGAGAPVLGGLPGDWQGQRQRAHDLTGHHSGAVATLMFEHEKRREDGEVDVFGLCT